MKTMLPQRRPGLGPCRWAACAVGALWGRALFRFDAPKGKALSLSCSCAPERSDENCPGGAHERRPRAAPHPGAALAACSWPPTTRRVLLDAYFWRPTSRRRLLADYCSPPPAPRQLAARSWLCAPGCMLLAACSWTPTTGQTGRVLWPPLQLAAYCWLCAPCRVLLVDSDSPPIHRRKLLAAARRLPIAAFCSPPTTRRMLLAAYYWRRPSVARATGEQRLGDAQMARERQAAPRQ